MRKKVFKTLAMIAVMVSTLAVGMTACAAETYTVENGDYLKKVAKKVLGDESKWEMIYEANKAEIKNPNLIYKGQVLIIPGESEEENTSDVTAEQAQEATQQTEQAEVNTMETDTAADNTAAVVMKNVPAGDNPVFVPNAHDVMDAFTYVLMFGDPITCFVNEDKHIAEATDAYGVVYREYEPGANEVIKQQVADFMAKNPDSQFTSYIKENGDNVVIVTGHYYLTLDGERGEMGWFSPVNCEPENCLYIFFAGKAFEENIISDVCNGVFTDVADKLPQMGDLPR